MFPPGNRIGTLVIHSRVKWPTSSIHLHHQRWKYIDDITVSEITRKNTISNIENTVEILLKFGQ